LAQPVLVFAQGTTANSIIDVVTKIIQGLILVVIGAALLVFLWGILRLAFVKESADRKKAITFMVWGGISLFVTVSVWGLVHLLRQTLGLENDDGRAPDDIPQDVPATEGVVTSFKQGPLYDAIAAIGNVIQDIIPVIIVIAVLVFLWGVFNYVRSGDAKKRSEGVTFMTWGIVSLTVMAFTWAFVVMLQQFFNIRDGEQYDGTISGAEYPTTDGARLGGNANTIPGVVERILAIVQDILPVLLLLGTLFFIWGVFSYIRSENVQKKAQASGYIAWGIGVLFVLMSVWGIVYAIGQTFGLEGKIGGSVGTQSGDKIDSSAIQGLIKK